MWSATGWLDGQAADQRRNHGRSLRSAAWIEGAFGYLRRLDTDRAWHQACEYLTHLLLSIVQLEASKGLSPLPQFSEVCNNASTPERIPPDADMSSRSWSFHLSDLDAKALIGMGFGLACLYWALSVALQWYRLSHIPGPFLNSITTLRSFWWVKNTDFNTFVLDLQRDYGKIVRLTPTGVMVDDPEVGWHINSARSAYKRSGWYESMKFNPWGGTVLTEMNPVSHDKRKAKLLHGFSGRGLQNVERRTDQQVAALKEVLRARIAQNPIDSQARTAVLDISRILHYFQVDLITYTGLGESWGNLPKDKDHYNYLQDGTAAVALAHAASMVPFLRWIMFSDTFLRFFGPSRTNGWLG